ncbi:hypothetical protein TSMEX_008282, partial [Taenia solium]
PVLNHLVKPTAAIDQGRFTCINSREMSTAFIRSWKVDSVPSPSALLRVIIGVSANIRAVKERRGLVYTEDKEGDEEGHQTGVRVKWSHFFAFFVYLPLLLVTPATSSTPQHSHSQPRHQEHFEDGEALNECPKEADDYDYENYEDMDYEELEEDKRRFGHLSRRLHPLPALLAHVVGLSPLSLLHPLHPLLLFCITVVVKCHRHPRWLQRR